MADSSGEVTQLLAAWSQGDQAALDRLMPIVYDELHRLAHSYMDREQHGHTLQTTALVNEAYLRLIEQRRMNWENRAQFFGIAAKMMRRILVDFARRRHYLKRGGDALRVSLGEAADTVEMRSADLIALDDALSALAARDRRKSQVVELRFFGGLSVEETALALGVSPSTVLRDWSLAQAWLYRELSREDSDGAGTREH
jgi:RNA polymerase sigma factor (TIGR02999 family)